MPHHYRLSFDGDALTIFLNLKLVDDPTEEIEGPGDFEVVGERELLQGLVKDFFEIDGIDTIVFDRHEIEVNKSDMFIWTDLIVGIIGALKNNIDFNITPSEPPTECYRENGGSWRFRVLKSIPAY